MNENEKDIHSADSDPSSVVEVLDTLRQLQEQSACSQVMQQASPLPVYTTKLTSTTSALQFPIY